MARRERDDDPVANGETPAPVSPSSQDAIAAIKAAYLQYLGRAASEDEAVSWARFPQGVDAAIDAIRSSPEAATYREQRGRTENDVPGEDGTGGITGTNEPATPVYSGPFAGFDSNRMSGGANDSSKTNAKYYLSEALKGYDPYRFDHEGGYREQVVSAINQQAKADNTPFQYRLNSAGELEMYDPNDGGWGKDYVGGRPLGYDQGAGWDDAAKSGQWQWLAAKTGAQGGTGQSTNTLASLNGSNAYGGSNTITGYNGNTTGGGGGGIGPGTPTGLGTNGGTTLPFQANGNNPTYWQDVGQNFGSLLEPWSVKFEYAPFASPAPFVAGTLRSANAPASSQTVMDPYGNPITPQTTVAADPYGFNTTTTATPQNAAAPDWTTDPGYDFRIKEATKAIERAAASNGTLLTGGTLKALNNYTQDAASQEYGNIYNRKFNEWQTNYNKSLGEYQMGYNKALGEYQQAANVFQNNQSNLYNRLAGLAGLGQTSTNQLASTGLGYAGLNANTLTNNANTLANLYGQAANSSAAGLVGSSNAWNSALGTIANNLNQTGYNLAWLNR